MSNNETLIAIPSDVTTPTQLRKFLVTMIVQLDIVLGYRGGEEDSLKSLAARVAALEQAQ